jgi:Zn-finger protein
MGFAALNPSYALATAVAILSPGGSTTRQCEDCETLHKQTKIKAIHRAAQGRLDCFAALEIKNSHSACSGWV